MIPEVTSLEDLKNKMHFFTMRGGDPASNEEEKEAVVYALWLELLIRNDEDLCENYSEHVRKVSESGSTGESYGAWDFKNILKKIICAALDIHRELTLVLEYDHIDASYRDTYYSYYSKQHFDFQRRSVRLSLFSKSIEETEFRETAEEDLQKFYLGSLVLNYLNSGIIGQTLLHPKTVKGCPLNVRLSCFETTVHGKRLTVNAFPYRMQDRQTMRCAEVTLFNLISYYSNEFHDYSVVLPNEILKIEELDSVERVTPAKGLTYPALSRVLFQVGFYPRLYNASQLLDSRASGFSQGRTFRRLLHWYIDSGIPVAVNVDTGIPRTEGHSLLCIGYTPLDSDTSTSVESSTSTSETETRPQQKLDDVLCIVGPSEEDSCLYAVFSADFHTECIVIDDNQEPYATRSYERLSRHSNMRNQNYVVALHQRMTLDALDAYESFLQIISFKGWGLNDSCKGYLKNNNIGRAEKNPLVLRMFMASVRSYKRSRIKDSKPLIAVLYDGVPLPHFIWVLEIYQDKDHYRRGKAFAEIVLDATSGGLDNPTSSVIIMRYPGTFTYRTFDKTQPISLDYRNSYTQESDPVSAQEWELISSYKNNLESVESIDFPVV